ncbi:pathogenesis-related protein PR-1-like [Primulina huaijiensis]|uniref:pathogenesis-related protein PR-1-like n=1 Tax=Primulina huaijiensis TaxID=1492673 RepID=UPI003CC71931
MKPRYITFILVFLLLFTDLDNNVVTCQDEIQQFLYLQNSARSEVGLAPLQWDWNVARYAEWYAYQRQVDCALEHSHGPYGENIFWGSGVEWTPDQAAQSWVDEAREYDYWSNSCVYGQQCGHYTQIVWRNTRRLGCARVVCYGGRGVFMTCNYDPPGNYIGQRPY